MQVGAFPIDSEAMNKFRVLYEASRGFIVMFLPIFVAARAILNLAYLRGSVEYVAIIRDLVFAVILLASFMQLLEGITLIPSYYADMLKDYATYELKLNDTAVFDYFSFFAWFMIACYWISYIIYFICLALLAAFGAYIIVAGTMFQSYWVLKATFWLIVVLSSWPLIWYSINIFIGVLTKDQNGIMSAIITCILNGIKILVPIAAFLKLWNSSPVNHARGASSWLYGMGGIAAAKMASGGAKIAAASLGDAKFDSVKSHLSLAKVSTRAVASAIPQALAQGITSKAMSLGSRMIPQAGKKNAKQAIKSISARRDDETNELVPLTSKFARKLGQYSPQAYAQAKANVEKTDWFKEKLGREKKLRTANRAKEKRADDKKLRKLQLQSYNGYAFKNQNTKRDPGFSKKVSKK